MIARLVARRLLRRIEGGHADHRRGRPAARLRAPRRAAATVHVHVPARVWRASLRGSRGLGEAYMDGRWDAHDLTALVAPRRAQRRGLDRPGARSRVPRASPSSALRRVRRNTPRRARKDIARPLRPRQRPVRADARPTMMYSCGALRAPRRSLEDAQVAKLERVCAKLDLGPHDHLLEIGTGWGGLAIHAAQRHGCRVTTTTISREQHDVAASASRQAGVGIA